jgi:hypothetical protein
VYCQPFIKKILALMSPRPLLRPSGRLNTYMSKARAENPYKNLGRIRRRRSTIRGGKDSNLPSIGMTLIEIINSSMLRVNPRNKTPWEKAKDHRSNVGDAKKIIYTRIAHIERTE